MSAEPGAGRNRDETVVPFGKRKPVLLSAEEMLGFIVPALEDAESAVSKLRQMMDRERQRLADERRVAFIREEQVRKEFGNG